MEKGSILNVCPGGLGLVCSRLVTGPGVLVLEAEAVGSLIMRPAWSTEFQDSEELLDRETRS